jgi:hypothetical protein
MSTAQGRRFCDNAVKMPCLLLFLVLAFPRILLAWLFFTSNYLQHAYHSLLLPLLGFFFLPLTTLTYAWMMNSHRPLEGTNLLILVIAAVIDVSGLGGGEWHRRSRY